MSKFVESDTQFTDQECLVQALLDLGYAQVEVHKEAHALFGYQNDERDERAHVIVRRFHVGNASNDVGFELRDGRFVARISEYDQHHTFTRDRQMELRQRYACRVLVKQAGKNRLSWREEKLPDGRVKLRISVR